MFQKGLKNIVAVQTHIASVDGDSGTLQYRGVPVAQAIHSRSFEELAFFMWEGRFLARDELEQFTGQFNYHRELPEHIQQLIRLLPAELPLMDGLRTTISAYSTDIFNRLPGREQAIALTAAMPAIIASLYRQKHGLRPIPSNTDLGHTANFLWLLTGILPKQVHIDALGTYLKLTMEHGMNASTFAARVTISTESDLTAAVTSALGTMKGPLHGGAPSGVIDLLEEIAVPDHIRSVVLNKLQQGAKIMGFGHRIYRTADPRSVLLREKCLELQAHDPWLDLAVQAEEEITELLAEHKPGRQLHTNVEFYAAAVMRAIQLPPELFTPVFSAARSVGWCAHALEQLEDNVIFRPQSEYIGS
ncbi:citrate/2-methylcitrate synthase [Planococcus lenghuensis]|uniref:Citrate synthase n=1 Tax=Planococcus lenghuensis TaxID=2213202 RepID=A0A1Q2KUF9_9BACL|nr:citrate/2-methylcitrate synthase [Planococcus lenghuensis]AQQ51819.1 citrate synthase/methylcitrate synthase [Planococcus lenghuensis]